MDLNGIRVGFAFTGSFCTLDKMEAQVQSLLQAGADVFPIFSTHVQTIDSRFGSTKAYMERIAALTGRSPIRTIEEAEPIGPKGVLDILLIAPCTGNTLAKLAGGITDTPVLMAAKAHLRNSRPLVLSLSTNDALGMNFKNIGQLYPVKNIYFVPFGQDDPVKKPHSMTACVDKIPETLKLALEGIQIQPVLQSKS
ncbi:MAG: dipicolinate synthase subunit B [Lachnospiraceae bacterium]|nr:dipicolinate synthase subunit B [Lachnospiraceae bacterium]